MNERKGFPTVTELIGTILRDARFAIAKNRRRSGVKPSDPAGIPRTTPVMDIIRDAIHHNLIESDVTEIDQTVAAAIREFANSQKETRGLNLRHPEVWFLYPVEVVHAQLDAMMYRNQQIKGVIAPQDFADWLVEYGVDERTPAELHRKSAIREAMREAWGMDDEDSPSFVDLMQSFADEYYIHLDSPERHELERCRTLETICDYLTEKLQERKPNDGLVQYGSMRGAERFEQEREQFDGQWGGINGAGAGLAVKHGSDLFEILGSTYGMIDKVPGEDRIGELEGARAPIRIWLRTAPREVTEGLGMFARLNKELEHYQAHPDSPHVDYWDHEAMLDDGWVLD